MKQRLRLNPCRNPPRSEIRAPCAWATGAVCGGGSHCPGAILSWLPEPHALLPVSWRLQVVAYHRAFAQAATWPAAPPTLTVWASEWMHAAALQSVC